jgi:hypothetical protein
VAGLALADLHGFAVGTLGGHVDVAAIRARLEDAASRHEVEAGRGRSARARALVAEADRIARAHPEKFAGAAKKVAARERYDRDPAVRRLQREWRDLNVEAERLATRLGEATPGAWAQSTRPELARHRARLAAMQERDRALRRKHALEP